MERAVPPVPPGQSKLLHPDAQALRDYLTAGDAVRYDQLPHGVVMVGVTHSNLGMSMPDIRLDLHTTIEGVKEKLYTHCGTKPHHQQLVLKHSSGETICRLDDDSRMLGYYSVESGMCIHVIDNDPYSLSRGGGLEDVSKVKKYTMSEEAYDKRKGTLREWIREQKSKDPNWQAPWNDKSKRGGSGSGSGSGGDGDSVASKEPPRPPATAEDVAHMQVGMRCECQPGGRRGIVMYLGEVEGAGEGYWVGVKLDEPFGRNDGSTKGGQRYFECPQGYGSFIRPHNVEVGDFPERGIDDEEDDDSDGDEI